jgi:hypothetical protein
VVILDASKVVEHICLTNTEDASRARKLCANSDIIVGDQTQHWHCLLTIVQYNLLRISARQIGFNLYTNLFSGSKNEEGLLFCYENSNRDRSNSQFAGIIGPYIQEDL